MFNSGYRNRKAGDGAGVINVQSQYIQKIAPNPTITSWSIQGSDDTALNPAGGQTVLVNGSGFVTGVSATLNGVQIGAVTLISSTQISFTAPANAGGSYTLIVYNTSGEAAILVPGLTYSSVPTWTTAAGSIGTYYETTPISSNVVATSDSALTYSLASGSLPTGATLYANGVITGTAPVDSGSTTYTFAITATDAELQDVTRTFTMTINVDVVTWVTPANGATISLAGGVASNVLSATDAAGYSVSYTANALPTGLSLTGNTVSGTATTAGSTSTLLTATAATTGRTATNTITWVVVLGDSYFQYDAMLLSASASITTPSFVNDASTINARTTVFGDTRAQNFNPYQPGYYSNYFDGTGDYLDIAGNTAFDLSTADFTIEGWFYPRAANGMIVNYGVVPGSSQGSYNYQVYAGGASLVVRYSTGGFTSVNSSNAYNLNAWNYFCISRTTTSISIYLNGTTTTGSIAATINNNASSTLRIGMDIDTNYPMNGYISNLRILKGTATPSPSIPTTPFTAVSNTSLLTCQSNRLIDNSTNNFTITKNGDVSVKSANPFALNSSYATYGSGYFDGSGDYLTIPYSSSYNIASSTQMTFECWAYPTTTGAFVMANRNWNFGGTGPTWGFFLTATNLYPQWGIAGTGSATYVMITSTIAAKINQWNHIAFSRDASNVVRVFVNGVLGGSRTDSQAMTSASGDIFIGNPSGGTATYANGYMSDMRLVIGSCVYSSDSFTPPTAPLTAVANTQLLTLQTDGPYNNNQFQDNSNFNNLVVRTGNPTNGTFSPYGVNWSNYFDGTGDYLLVAHNTALQMASGDFTIEFWIYFNSITSYQTPFSKGYTAAGDLLIQTGNGNGRLIVYASGSAVITESGTGSVGSWIHYALVRNGSTLTLYRDGTSSGSASNSTNFNSTAQVGIAAAGTAPTGGFVGDYPINGYLSNLRMVKGTAVYTSNFTVPTAPITAVANTQLLTCQSGRFIDNSPNNFAVTKNGDTSVQKFSPFSTITVPAYYSTSFNGSTDYLTLSTSSLSVITGDFTVECWIYATTNNRNIYAMGAETSSRLLFFVDASNRLSYDVFGVGTTTFAGSTVTLNTWTHVAWVRSGTTVTAYINGTSVGTSTLSGSVGNGTQVAIGVNASLNSGYWSGYISNLRVTKQALYTTTFTPSTSPLTTTSQGATAGNVSLLTCQSNTLIDNSPNYFAITAATTTVKPLLVSPFTPTASSSTTYSATTFGGSMYFDGTGDYLGITSLPAFGTGDFTIDGWVYNSGDTTNRGIFEFASAVLSTSVGISLAFYSNGSGWQYSYGASTTATVAATLLANVWYHFAFSRSSGTLKIYINGAQIASLSDTTNYTFNALTVGGYYSTSQLLTGYISDMRVIPGIALYTSAFYPGASPSVPVGTKPGATSIYNSSVLLNGTSGGVVDSSRNIDFETVGNTTTTTSLSPYAGGGVSYYFDGTGDYLLLPTSQTFVMRTGNFTVEGWVYPTNFAAYRCIFDSRTAAANNTGMSLILGNATDGTWGFYKGTTAVITASTKLTLNTWQYVAVVRSGSTITLYLGGTSVGTATDAQSFTDTGGRVGATIDNSCWLGYISDFRVTRGYARYTSTFTPPTTPLNTN